MPVMVPVIKWNGSLMAKKEVHDYSAFVSVGHNQPEEELTKITKLAEKQLQCEKNIAQIEDKLVAAKQEWSDIAEKQLPEIMDRLGLTEFRTKSGIRVEVDEKVRCSLSKENKPKAHDWLEKNGYGGIIKSAVVVGFSRNEIKEANELISELKSRKRIAVLERKVEPATLTAFVKTQLEEGKNIPVDIFGVFRQRSSKIEQ